MSTCDTCGSRLPDDVEDWCPVCGAPLVSDAGSWELGGPAPSPANAPGKPAAEFRAASLTDSEAPPRWRRLRGAVWVVLALALLAGLGTPLYLLTRTPTPDGASGTTVTSSPRTQDETSAGAHAYTTDAENYRPGTSLATSSEVAPRFPAYDAASGKYGYADETGAMVIGPRFDRAGQFFEGLAPVQVQADSGSAGYGYIDTTGAVVIEPRFRRAFAFSEGLARVEVAINGVYRYGYIDRSGTMVIEPRYATAWDFSEGLARVGLNDASGLFRYGFIDRTDTLVIGPRFESARDFSEGLAAVAIDGKWGYIDRLGVWVIEPRFYNALSFLPSGLAVVDLEDPGTAANDGERVDQGHPGLSQALIDKTGAVVSERHTE